MGYFLENADVLMPNVVLAGMQQASMNLTESLHEVYEPDWHGKDDVMTIGKVSVASRFFRPLPVTNFSGKSHH